MPKSPKEMYEAIVTNLPKKTGKTLDQWMDLVKKKKGLKERDDQVEWLKIRYRLGNGQAKTIIKMMHEGLADYDEDDLMKQHFQNGKEYLKPLYDKLLASVKKWGKISVSVNKTYLSLINSQQFAILKCTKDGMIIGVPGIAVKAAKNKDFTPSKNLGSDKITHRIMLIDESDLSEGVMKVLKASYMKF